MKTMKILLFFTEMGCEKCNILNFHVIFFNNYISITVADIILYHVLPLGTLSQMFYLGPRF